MATKKKQSAVRADVLLVDRGLIDSRTKAQARILAGQVYSGEVRIDKPGTPLPADAPLTVREAERFVSRGGYKLEGALEAFGVDVSGRVCVDIGASTGGFTDCLLQRHAARVYAVDVGHGLLAHRLVSDARVTVMDRTNARFLEAEHFPESLNFAVIDASFIGLGQLSSALARILPRGAQALAMIKPQFEVGRQAAREARGVISDPEVRGQAIERVVNELERAGFRSVSRADSVLAGPRGNVEHFLLAERC
jgi:23S rRNA (cytidine1920-2'-O)/16S rRNA (cytidine1409-2'-O)-methyltransferase